MKKTGLLMLLLVLIPSVVATIGLNAPDQSVYNLGDPIGISGYVSRETDFDGVLKLSINCGATYFDLPMIAISLDGREKKTFPQDFAIPKIVVSTEMEGTCFLEFSLVEGNQVIESASSSNFLVNKDLQGSFFVDKNVVQAGDSIVLTGTISKLNGLDTSGAVSVYFADNNSKFFVDVASFSNGDLIYTFVGNRIPAGIYSIDLNVRDIYGNNKNFEDVASFTFVSDLYASASLSKNQVYPGDKIKIFGDAKTTLQEEILDGTVAIRFMNETFDTIIEGGVYSYDLIVPADITSGKHTVEVRIVDNFGNNGVVDVVMDVIAKLNELAIDLSANQILPGETIEITPLVYDQAGDPLDEAVTISLRDSRSKLVIREVVDANKPLLFTLPADANPGEFSVQAEVGGISKLSSFFIETLELLDISISGQNLAIINKGNTVYERPIRISYDDSVVAVKKTSLTTNQEVIYPLGRNVVTGVYDIDVVSGNFVKNFPSVYVDGTRSVSNSGFLSWILFITVIGLVVYALLAMFKRRKKLEILAHRRMRKEAKYISILKKKKAESALKPVSSIKFASREEALKDYREQMLKQIKESETQIDKRDSEEKDDKPGRLFRLFD